MEFLRYFDPSKITLTAVFDSLLSLFAGLLVAVLFYLFVKKNKKFSLASLLWIGGTAAFFEKIILDILRLDFIYWQLHDPRLTVIINAMLIAFISLMAYWQMKIRLDN